jgi:uncharacterized membrane protein YdbT with pleckstrin-like domain
MRNALSDEQMMKLERPDPALWRYYIIRAILTGPGVLITLPYLFFRYYTLRYRFDAEGIHMKVGILFRREVNLTYARIQDIHLHSGLIQRWLGIADLQVQTASGSATPEIVIEGFKEYEAMRDTKRCAISFTRACADIARKPPRRVQRPRNPQRRTTWSKRWKASIAN